MKRQEPFNVLRNPNSWDNAPRAEAIVVAATSAAFAATTAGQIAIAAVSLALTVATNAIISALTPAPPSPKQSLLVNSRNATGPQEFVYGTVRKGGTITYMDSSSNGKVLYQVITLAGHEVEDIEAVYLNDELAVISDDGYNTSKRSGPGWVTYPTKWSEDDDRKKHEVRIFYHNGNQTSVSTPFANSSYFGIDDFFAQDSGMTNPGPNFVGNGVACLFVRYTFEADVFDEGLPLITVRMKGKKVYDPRTQTTAFSNNAALCVRDYLTSSYGLNDPEVDDLVFSNAANICEENVDLAQIEGSWASGVFYGSGFRNPITTAVTEPDIVWNNGVEYECILEHTSSASTEPGVGADWQTYWKVSQGKGNRYTIDGVVKADQPYGDVLQQMMSACGGTLFWGAGKWKLQVGEYNAPTKTLTLDDLRSSISLQTRVNLRDQFNQVQGTFVDASQRYIAADYPPYPNQADYPSSAFLAQDGGVEQVLNLDLPFTTSGSTAQRLAKMTLLRGREQMTFSAEFGLNAFDVEVGEIVALDMERYGWTGKEFEVVGWQFGADQDAGDLRVTLTLRETSEAAFDWDAEESEIIGNDTNLDGIVEPVTNLTATANGSTNAAGVFINSILVDWDHPNEASYYRVEWTKNTAIDYAANGGVVEEADAVTTREQFIYKAYIELLYRQPDQDGFDYYNTGAASSYTEEQVRAELLTSPERNSLNYTGTLVYRPATEYVILPVVDNTIYHIRVRAINDFAQASEWRSVTFDSTADTTVPNAPTSVIATGYFQSAVISWTPPTQNTDGSTFDDLKQYNIYRSLADNFASATVVGSSQTPSFKDAGLDDNTVYYYWVTAEDFSGNESLPSLSNDATTDFISAAQMVDDIREEIGAARIDVVSSLPSGSGYSVGDFVFLTSDKKLYQWNGSSWLAAVGDVPSGSITSTEIANDAITTPKLATNSVTTDSLAANSVTASQLTTNSVITGKIAAGAVSADKIAVTDLAAITANLGEVTAGSIDTLSGSVGMQINVAAKPRAVYIYQNSTSIYGLFGQNIADDGGFGKFTSKGGWTLELGNNRSNFVQGVGPSMAINAGMGSGLGGRAFVGVSNAGGGYAVDCQAGDLKLRDGSTLPFTGSHEAMILKTEAPQEGDILCDKNCITTDIVNSFTEVELSHQPMQKEAVGVFYKNKSGWDIAAFVDREATAISRENAPDGEEYYEQYTVYKIDKSIYENDYNPIIMNSVGEGGINVCGEGGNISKGDLIVTSSTAGKGMKQSDDIVRSYTVAKAREDVTFSSPTEVKMVACIYLCG